MPLPEDNKPAEESSSARPTTDNEPEVDKYADAFKKAREEREARERERSAAGGAMPAPTAPQLRSQSRWNSEESAPPPATSSRWKVDAEPERQNVFGFDSGSKFSNDARNSAPPRDYASSAPAPSASGPREISKAEIEARNALAAKEAAKAEKAKKREEEERAAKEAKEAKLKAERDAIDALKAAEDNARAAADAAVASGHLGEKLYDHIQSMEKKPSGASLIFKVLSLQTELSSLVWCTKAQYGSAIKSLLEGKIKDQVAAIYAIQEFCHSKKFPKIDVKGTKRNFIEVVFQLLYKNDIFEHEAFSRWSDDDNLTNIPGKQDAAFQTVQFFTVLNEVSDEEYDEDEEEEEIDAPREIVR